MSKYNCFITIMINSISLILYLLSVYFVVSTEESSPEFIVYHNQACSIKSPASAACLKMADVDEVADIRNIVKEILKERDNNTN